MKAWRLIETIAIIFAKIIILIIYTGGMLYSIERMTEYEMTKELLFWGAISLILVGKFSDSVFNLFPNKDLEDGK